jgi:hypothetical protein
MAQVVVELVLQATVQMLQGILAAQVGLVAAAVAQAAVRVAVLVAQEFITFSTKEQK